MFEPVYRKRVRPSPRSLVYSSAVLAVIVVFTLAINPFAGAIYIPFAIGGAIAVVVALIRQRGVRSGLPPPYGQGKVQRIDARKTARDAMFLIAGSALAFVGVFGSVIVVSPYLLFFPVVYGMMFGLPLSEVLFYLVISRIERTSAGRIYMTTEQATEGGVTLLVKSIELRQTAQSGAKPKESR